MCVFTKTDSITPLLTQLTLRAPKSFSCNNIHGATKENSIKIEEEDETKEAQSTVANEDALVAKKIKQFAKGMKKEEEDDEDSSMSMEVEVVEVEENNNNIKDSIDNAENNNEKETDLISENDNIKHTKKKKRKRKDVKKVERRNKNAMGNTVSSLGCSNIHELSELVIAAISVMDDIERGSLSEHEKSKSFLGR